MDFYFTDDEELAIKSACKGLMELYEKSLERESSGPIADHKRTIIESCKSVIWKLNSESQRGRWNGKHLTK